MCGILDIHCSAHWPHDTQTGRRVALRNTEKIESLAGDKGYDDQSLRDALRSEGVRPLLRHRLFAAYDHAHNARLDSELYGQRWMAETAFSAIKRRFGPAVHPRAWYREFRELVLTATVYNLEQALKQWPRRHRRIQQSKLVLLFVVTLAVSSRRRPACVPSRKKILCCGDCASSIRAPDSSFTSV